MTAMKNGDRSRRIRHTRTRTKLANLQHHFDDLADTIAEQEEAQKKSEAIIAAEASRRRALFEHIRDGIAVLNDDGSVFESNRKFAEMLGYSQEEVQSRMLTGRQARPF